MGGLKLGVSMGGRVGGCTGAAAAATGAFGTGDLVCATIVIGAWAFLELSSSTAPLALQVEFRRENDAALDAHRTIESVSMDFGTLQEKESTRVLLGALLASSIELKRTSLCGIDQFGFVCRRKSAILEFCKR
jgi:hypothetical protein